MNMATDFENEYIEELQNIERNILLMHRLHPELVDYHIDKVLRAVVRTIEAEQKGKPVPKLKLKGNENLLYEQLYGIYQLTTNQLAADSPMHELAVSQHRRPDEIVACFKRLQKSIKTFSDLGRRGYLSIIEDFFPDMDDLVRQVQAEERDNAQ